MTVDVDEFNKNCGILLRAAGHIESTLDFFISNYFSFPQSQRTFLLSDLIITELGFERKVNLFIDICKEEEIKEEIFNKIKNSIKFVQNKRNLAAHGQALIDSPDEGIKLQKRKSYWFKRDEVKLTPVLMKQIDDERLSAINGINEIYLQISDPTRKKESKIIGF
jgi:hypothetical protein